MEFWKEPQGIIAIFPDRKYAEIGGLLTAYTSKEGFVGCDPMYLKMHCTKAIPEEYKELEEEIKTKGI